MKASEEHIHQILEELKHKISNNSETSNYIGMEDSETFYEAEVQLRSLINEARIATAQLILNTCKYDGRELYLSTTAVESLLKDLKNNDDSHKALTALAKRGSETGTK